MARSTSGDIGTILGLEGAESYSTLSLILKDTTERHFSTREISTKDLEFASGLIQLSELVQTVGATPNRVPVLLDNIDKAAGLELSSESLAKAVAIVGRFYKAGDLETHVELFRGEAIPTEGTETTASMEVLSDLTAAGYCVASSSMLPACQLVYKGPQCGYAGSKPTCAKTRKGPNGCQEHDAEEDDYKFGGFEYPDIQPAEPPTTGSGDGPGRTPSCFPAGTFILMADFSQKPIEKILEGDLVMSFDDDWKLVPARVAGPLQIHHGIDRFLDLDRGAITPTPEHGFFDPSMQKHAARTFRPGDKLRRMRGDSWMRTAWIDWTIDSRTWLDLRTGVDVFNFEVEKYRRYIANRFAVSNSKLPTEIE